MLAYGATLKRVRGFGMSPEISNRVHGLLKGMARDPETALLISAYGTSPEGMEGVKTIAFELADQLPDIDDVFVPVGGAGLLTAVFRGFCELRDSGKVRSIPRIHAVQPEGCATVTGPLNRGEDVAVEVQCTSTISGLQVANPIDANLAIKAVKATGGTGQTVSDPAIHSVQKELVRQGVYCEPAGATAYTGYLQAIGQGQLSGEKRAVCLVTGHGFKDPESVKKMISGMELSLCDLEELERRIGGSRAAAQCFRLLCYHTPAMVKKVICASPRGFCAGVVRAIDVVNIALGIYRKPLYVRKEIVHNPHVVEELRRKGAVFVDRLDEVPEGKTVIFSAHGVSPQVWEEARAKSLKIIDATCPLVTKVHLEAMKYARQGYTIVLIGHKGHDEVIGTMGEAPKHMQLVSSIHDVEQLDVPDPEKVSYLTQTTLSLEDTREIIRALRKKFPAIQGPPSEDICYATQNRQMAVRELARITDLILVVGAANSSNSNRLVEEAGNSDTPARLINDVHSIEEAWLDGVETVGVTSGASAPEILVDQVVGFFRGLNEHVEVEEVVTREEHVHFALPANLVADVKYPA